jgi:xanthine dehydrogenase accessory factor
MTALWASVVKALETGGTCVHVEVTKVEGSAPREAGATLVVTPQGNTGTIGGGALEWQALKTATSLLGQPFGKITTTHTLGPDLGQCCGGRVTLETTVYSKLELDEVRQRAAQSPPASSWRNVAIFGAGHTGLAVMYALTPLPFYRRWIDSRPGAFPGTPFPNATTITTEDAVSELAKLPDGSFVLVFTHSHALDFEIVDAALRNDRIPFVGLIGSQTKRERFERRLRQAGISDEALARLACPVGLASIKSKHPSAIAAGIAAQLLERDELLKTIPNPVVSASCSATKLAGVGSL